MSRIAAVDPASGDPRSKPLLDAVNNVIAVTPNLFRVTAPFAAALEGLLGLHGAVGNGSLNGKTREASLLWRGWPVVPHHPSSDLGFGDAVKAGT